MMKVNNKQVVREVAWTTYKAEKKRNLLAIFAIGMASFLTAIMMAIGASYWDTLTERQLRMQGIDYDISLSEPEERQVEIVRAMGKVKYAGLRVFCMEAVQFEDQAIDGADFYWLDEVCWEKQTAPALEKYEGHYPVEEDEVMLSEALLRAMHVEGYKVGMELPLTYHTMANGDGQLRERVFTLSGWFLDYSGKEKGYVSKAFFDATGVKQTDFDCGALMISLVNPLYFAKDIAQMNDAVGISGGQRIVADDFAVPQFCKVTAALAAMLFMVFASAYLFIFNTMYISIAKNIRYYGQLKTVGMTSVQLKGIVYRQAFWNALAGMAVGLTGAAFLAKAVIPKILLMVGGAYSEEEAVPVGPWIFLAAGGFTLLVNAISCRKPTEIAGNCSPIEAMHYTPGASGKNMRRREHTSLPAMAFQNMFRDKKQAAAIFLSSALALAIFFTANVIILANDAKHILNEVSSFDMEFVNQTMMKGKIRQIFSEEKMAELAAIDGVKDVRRVTSTLAEIPYQEDVFGEYYRALYASRYSPGNYGEDMESYKNDEVHGHWRQWQFASRLVGIDGEGFAYLNGRLGNVLDPEAFENGEVAITTESVYAEGDFGMEGKVARFLLPEGLSPDTEYSVQIAAICEVGDVPNYFGSGYSPDLIVSESYAKKLLGETYAELIRITYKEPYEQDTENAVKAVFAGEKKVTSRSKLENYQSMLGAEMQMKVLGYSIAGIMAALALFNYVNMMAAGIHNRAKEFATLESIGMTSRQICRMLRMEGIGYGVVSVMASLLVGIPFSYVARRGLSSYQSLPYAVPWVDSLVLYVVAVALCMAVPILIYRRTQNASVVERLQKVEGFLY